MFCSPDPLFGFGVRLRCWNFLPPLSGFGSGFSDGEAAREQGLQRELAFLAELPHTVPVSALGLVIRVQTQPIVRCTQLYSWEEWARELLSCSSLRQLLQTTAERPVLVRGCSWRLLQAAPQKLFRKTLIFNKEGN